MKFVLTIRQHSLLATLLKPYLVKFDDEGNYLIVSNILSQRVDKDDYTDEQNELIKWTLQCGEKEICRVFSKEKITVSNFMAKLKTDDKLLILVKEYIEKRLLKCFNILRNSDIELFYAYDSNIIYKQDKISIAKARPQPIFNFTKTDKELQYFLNIKYEDYYLNLYQKKYNIINNSPCIIIIDKKVYFFDDNKDFNSKKLIPFFSKKFISVPQRAENKYFNTFIKKSVENFEVKAIGFNIDIVESNPNAILTLEKDWRNDFVLILKFDYFGNKISATNPIKSFVEIQNNNDNYSFIKKVRNYEFEQSKIDVLNSFNELKEGVNNIFNIKKQLSDTVDMLTWLNGNSQLLIDYGFDLKQHFYNKEYFLDEISLQLNLKHHKDWFDLYGTVTFGTYKIPFIKLKNHLLNDIKEFVLPNKQIAILPDEWFEKYATILKMGVVQEDKLQIDKVHAQFFNEELIEINKTEVEKANVLVQLKPSISRLLKAELRDYQQSGYQWMYSLYSAKLGVCLADDMGLGKTVQTLALILKIKENTNETTTKKANAHVQLSLFENVLESLDDSQNQNAGIIVMPKSLIHNWANEIEKFTPHLRYLKYQGSNRTNNINDFNNYDIILTSYGTLRNDIDLLSNYYYKFIILDESQFIKNPTSKIYLAVNEIGAEFKMVLTGTPIENSLIDLWAQLNFINNNLLGNLIFFKKEFIHPISQNKDLEWKKRQENKLKKLINPFILRRSKDEVLKDLPELTETIHYCIMSKEQQQIYDTEKSRIRNALFETIETHDVAQYNIMVLKGLQRLRQLANHPKLMKLTAEDDIDESALLSSGKFEEIVWTIENLVAENNKVLLFSSFVQHLQLFADFFADRKWKYSMLTGKTSKREQEIKNFNEVDDNLLFLISLKAGGVGLNLTSANYVLFLDPWWNPAVENQAISRAHRMGQKNKVMVYRFITENSIEQKILELQKRKKLMADKFINDNNPFKQMSQQDILELFN